MERLRRPGLGEGPMQLHVDVGSAAAGVVRVIHSVSPVPTAGISPSGMA